MPSFRSIKLSYSSPPPALPPCEEPTTPPPSPPPPRPPCSPCQHKNHSPPPPPPPPPTTTASPPPPPPPHNASLPASPPPPPPPQPGSIAPPPKTPPRASNYPSPSPSIPLPFYPAAIAPTPYFPPSSGPQQSIAPLAPPHSNHHPLEVGVSLGGLFFLSFLALGLNHIFGKKMFVPGSGSSGPSGGGELPPNAEKAVHVSEAVPAQPQPRGNTGLPGSDVHDTDPPSNDPSATEPRNVGQEEPHDDNQSDKEKKKRVKADTVVQSLRESTKLLEDLLRASNINPHRLPPQRTPSQQDRGETSSTPYPAVYNGDEFEEKEEVENADDDGGDQNPDKAAAESNAKEQEAGEDNQPEEVDQVDKPKSKEQDDDAHRASSQSLSVGKKLAPKKTRVGKAGPTSLANINAMKKIADLEDRKLDSDPIKESDREETVNPEDSKIEEDCAAVESVHEETVGDERVVEVTKQEEEAGESEELAVEKLDESKTDEHDAIVNIDDALKTTRKAEKPAGKKKPPGGRGPSSSARHINDIKKLQPDSAQQYFDQMIQAEGDGEQAEDNQDELKDDTAVNDDDDDMDTSIIDGKTPGKGKRRGRPEKQTAMSILKDFNKTHQKLKPEKEEKADDTNLQDEESQGNGEDHVDEGVPGDEEDYSWMQELGDLDAMGLVANLGLFNTWSKTVENLVERNRKLVYKLQKKINEPENSNRSRRTRVEQDEGKMSGALKGKVNMAVDEEDPQAAGEDDLDECGEVGAESSVPDAEAEEESQYLPAESEQGMRPVEKNIRAGNHGQQARAMGGALKGNAGRKSRSRAEQATSGKSKGKVKNAVDYKDISGFTNPEVAGEGEEEAVMNRLDEDEAVSPILDAGEESGEVEELETMNEEVERTSTEKGEEEEYQQGMWSAGEMPPMNFESLGKGSGAAKNIKAGKRAQGVYEEGAMKLVEEKSPLLKGRNIPVAKNIKSDQQAERPAISSALNVLESGVFGEQGLVTDDANKSFLKEYKNTDDDLRSIIPKEGNGAQSVSGALVQMGVGDEDISEFTNPDETDCSESWLVKGKDAAEEMPNESEVKRLVDEKSPVSSDARKRAAVAQIEQAPAMSSALDAVGMFDSQVILPEKGSDRQKKAVGGKHSLRQQAKGKGLSGARVKPAEHDIIADEVGGAKAGHRRTISQKRAPEIEEQTGEKLQPDPVPLDFEATEADAAKDFEATEVDDAEDFEATEGDAEATEGDAAEGFEATEGDAGATEVDAAADDDQSATPI